MSNMLATLFLHDNGTKIMYLEPANDESSVSSIFDLHPDMGFDRLVRNDIKYSSQFTIAESELNNLVNLLKVDIILCSNKKNNNEVKISDNIKKIGDTHILNNDGRHLCFVYDDIDSKQLQIIHNLLVVIENIHNIKSFVGN